MSNEWYTPSKYIEAAREVMGTIDLDPASCALANETVQATQYYTKEQDGLTLPWHGNVWLNPPYGQMDKSHRMDNFVKKFIHSYESKDMQQGIIFSLTGMYAQWYYDLLSYPVCFLRYKPVFTKDDGTEATHPFASCVFYLGTDTNKFREVFSQFGKVKE